LFRQAKRSYCRAFNAVYVKVGSVASYLFILFYYENRTQGTLKTIKKNKEQSTTG